MVFKNVCYLKNSMASAACIASLINSSVETVDLALGLVDGVLN